MTQLQTPATFKLHTSHDSNEFLDNEYENSPELEQYPVEDVPELVFQGTMEQEIGHGSRKRHQLYCFHCNRFESHYHSLQKKWYFSYLVGFTFGMTSIVGPYRCVCCGHSRLSRLNHIHPRMIGRSMMGKQTTLTK